LLLHLLLLRLERRPFGLAERFLDVEAAALEAMVLDDADLVDNVRVVELDEAEASLLAGVREPAVPVLH
jgi:hypothetical protein